MAGDDITYLDSRATRKPWWTAKRDDVGECVYGLVKTLKRSEGLRDRRIADIHHMRLYGNYDVSGDGSRPGSIGLSRGDDGRMRYNLCASAVDTAASVIAQQKPRPMFLTTEGDFSLLQKARKRTRALEGQLYDLGAYELGPQVFVDGAVLGTGAIYGYLHPETGRPVLERVMPLELVIDHADGIAGKPRCAYRVTTVPRDVLIGMYPKSKRKLQTAATAAGDDLSELHLHRDRYSDRVLVVEAWRLGSCDEDEGRHVVAVSNATLADEPWTMKRLPFAVYRWKSRQVGFWGAGIVEACRDPQWRINKLIRKNERLQDLGSNTYLLVEGNSKVKTESITNKPLEIVRYFGAPPVWQQTQGTALDLQQEIDRIREQTFSELGISSMTAEGKKPSGLDSGAAQRTHDDLLSRRHVMNAKLYEAFFMDIVSLVSDLNDAACDIDPAYSVAQVSTRGRRAFVADVEWAEVRVDEGDMRLRMWPTAQLPTTPQGKFAQVQEYIQAGWVSRPFAMSLLDVPDIDAATRIELADLDIAMHDVERILDGEDNVLPEPYQDLPMALDVARRSYLQARISGAPEGVLQAFRDYVDETLNLISSGAGVGQAAQQAQQAMLAPPQPSPELSQGAPPPEMGPMM